MQVTVSKKAILAALHTAAGILPSRIGAAYLRMIWLRADADLDSLEIRATDGSVEFSASVEADVRQSGFTGVAGKRFADLVKLLPGERFHLEMPGGEQTLRIVCPGSKYRLVTGEPDWCPSMADFPEDGAVSWGGEFFRECIDRCDFCLADDDIDGLSCLSIRRGSADADITVTGMNGHQMAEVRFRNEELHAFLPGNGILLRGKYLKVLKRWIGEEDLTVNLGGGRFFLHHEGRRESLSLPVEAYEYPDTAALLEKVHASENSLSVNREELIGVLRRIEIFTTDGYSAVSFALSPDSVELSVNTGDIGAASESILAGYSGKIKKLSFPAEKMSAVLGHFSSADVGMLLTENDGPCAITGVDDIGYLVIIMPMKSIDVAEDAGQESGDEEATDV
jgi:DNA polymerase-3 subunit beta